jgi:hypothetical protein
MDKATRAHQYMAMVDAARLAEWEFHNAVLAMRALIRGQFGANSDEAQAVGLKKKSKHKAPSKPAAGNV